MSSLGALSDAWQRFGLRVGIGADDECWPWLGYVGTTGYGHCWLEGRNHPAHRVAYRLWFGQWPENQIDHLCGNRRCVNPLHMEDVTARENTMRSNAPSALNAQKTHCPRGHPYDYENTRFKWCRTGLQRVCRECERKDCRERARRKAAERRAAA